MKQFKDKYLNKLHGFMEMMDGSDDYILLQVSALNLGKDNVEMHIMATGMDGGKPVTDGAKAEALLITAMEKSDDFKRFLTDAVMDYELLQAFKRMRKS